MAIEKKKNKKSNNLYHKQIIHPNSENRQDILFLQSQLEYCIFYLLDRWHFALFAILADLYLFARQPSV